MSYFKKWNLITGWVAFAIAAIAYLMTIEPTASLWDCAEFIATSYKLEVGHPPGAPLFMMIARFFTMFAPSTAHVGMMVNAMSALCGAFTVLFLCWSITHLARRIYERDGKQLNKSQTWAVLGAGLIGAVAYCFTDTQWFSAIEGEVYSMSSMFTALVFWCILQWEDVADQPHSTRWLILIAYLMGLSIGVHILNLLCVPAIVFVYYFKKYPTVTWQGVVKAILVSGVILVAINYIIIPYTIAVGTLFDRLFVNSFGLPVNSGFVFWMLLLFALCAFGIYITHKRGKALANTIVLCATFVLIGYSSFASMIIRAQADPPMNSNTPNNPYALLSVLNRDQYGDRPLLYGPYYSSPVSGSTQGNATYLGEDGKYHQRMVMTGETFPDEFKYLFPRVYNRGKAREYKAWGNITGRPAFYDGERLKENVPTAAENMRFFFSYQLNHMYWRYFLWNFVGRQNDIQSDGGLVNGNWLSGVRFIDQLYLGPQDDIPSEMAANKARNTYFFLPFLLGLIGLIYQLGRDKKNFTIVMWMFFMMGIALVIYFNTTPGEPRERDYVYAGSFYAYCIWIGLGVLAVRDWLVRIAKKENIGITVAAVAVCSCVPIILAAQNWDDHDRSGRYVARDIGWNYLQSCLPNSIIVNYGDNDTFPLWYNQEVEGVRPDVRIMNMSYLGMEGYIDQMKRRFNDSDPVPFTLPASKYTKTNEVLWVTDQVKERVSLRDLMNFIKRTDSGSKIEFMDGISGDYIPTRQSYLPVNKANAVASGIVKPEDAHLMVDSIPLNFKGGGLTKSDMMILDMLDNFDWARPIFFTTPQSLETFGLQDYLQFDGYAYRLVPIHTPRTRTNPYYGRVDPEYAYPLLMETFRYGNVADPKVYVDHFTTLNYAVMQTRTAFARAADALMAQGDTLRAVKALDTAFERMPSNQIRHSYAQTIPLIESYYKAGEFAKGNAVLEDYARVLSEYFNYFLRFLGTPKADRVMSELKDKIDHLEVLYDMAERYGQYDQADAIYNVISCLYKNPEDQTQAVPAETEQVEADTAGAGQE